MSIRDYPVYESYRDSGIEWIGVVPSEWRIESGRQCVYENKDKNTHLKETTVLSLSYGCVIVKDKDNLTGLVPNSYESYQIVQPGDIIIRGTDLQNDMTSLRTGLAKHNGIITSAYINLRSKSQINQIFLHYLLHSYDVKKVFYALGSGLRQNLSYLDFKYLKFPIPPLTEQHAISKFLDEKCTLIDQAIHIKEQEIDLLRERRQILIQETVTRGLNPNAKMVDSGVEWIGKIPAHWKVKRLKHGMRLNNGRDYKHIISNEGYPVYGSGGAFGFASAYLHDGEAILLGRKGTIDKPLYVKGKFWCVDTMFYAICHSILNTRFAYYVCKTIPFAYFSTATALPSMTQGDLNNNTIVIPPNEEQDSIVAFIDTVSTKIDDYITIKQNQINTLKEYKTTLIDAAVTGKIKVI